MRSLLWYDYVQSFLFDETCHSSTVSSKGVSLASMRRFEGDPATSTLNSYMQVVCAQLLFVEMLLVPRCDHDVAKAHCTLLPPQ